jgi:hypothetical protein
MKRIRIFTLPVCLVLFHACQVDPGAEGKFEILPRPQHFEIRGDSKLKAGDISGFYTDSDTDLLQVCGIPGLKPVETSLQAEIVCIIDSMSELPEEGYTMKITEYQVKITGVDREGCLYGLMTLRQLMEDAEEQDVYLPECRIEDYPVLSYRAIHIDIKHHREKLEYYYGLMDWLMSYKVNAVILEAEDKIRYELQPDVGSADALSIREWRELSEYARLRNIEISPLIQGLGHASFILKHDRYAALRDDPESDWAFNPLDPETYKVQFDLYRDALEAFPHGRYLHVGGDEVHTSGRGSGKSSLELQLIWLNEVCRFADENGRIPIFWDDMPLKHAGVYTPMFNTEMTEEEVDSVWNENEPKLAEFLDLFPRNCIYMRWNYQSPKTYGNIRTMEWFLRNGMQVMGATAGQRRWALMPQNKGNIESILSFATVSQELGLGGLLLTLWDDDSPHFELYKRGIIAFSEYTWTSEHRPPEELKAAYRHREFSEMVSGSGFAFIDRLEQPVVFWENAFLKKKNRRYLSEHENPIDEDLIELPDKDNRGEWSRRYSDHLDRAEAMMKTCDSISQIINRYKSLPIRNSYTIEIYEQVNEFARFAPKALLALRAYDLAANPEEEEESLAGIRNLREEFLTIREKLEEVYGQTRILVKPGDYILDQDHHHHLANQSISMDWLFYAEILFLEKVEALVP